MKTTTRMKTMSKWLFAIYCTLLVTSGPGKTCSDMKLQPLVEPKILKFDQAALNYKLEGNSEISVTLKVKLDISEKGRVLSIKKLEYSPAELAETTVTKLVKNAVFRPALLNGSPEKITDFDWLTEFIVQPKKVIKIQLER